MGNIARESKLQDSDCFILVFYLLLTEKIVPYVLGKRLTNGFPKAARSSGDENKGAHVERAPIAFFDDFGR